MARMIVPIMRAWRYTLPPLARSGRRRLQVVAHDLQPRAPLPFIAVPFGRRHIIRRDADEALAFEEQLRAFVDRAGEYVAQSERTRFGERARHQPAADALALEARDGVEADDLADSLIAVGIDLEPAHAGKLVRADLSPEA